LVGWLVGRLIVRAGRSSFATMSLVELQLLADFDADCLPASACLVCVCVCVVLCVPVHRASVHSYVEVVTRALSLLGRDFDCDVVSTGTIIINTVYIFALNNNNMYVLCVCVCVWMRGGKGQECVCMCVSHQCKWLCCCVQHQAYLPGACVCVCVCACGRGRALEINQRRPASINANKLLFVYIDHAGFATPKCVCVCVCGLCGWSRDKKIVCVCVWLVLCVCVCVSS
jgi:hypothetical protein